MHYGPLKKSLKHQKKLLLEMAPNMQQVSEMNKLQTRFNARKTTKKTLNYLLGLFLVITITIVSITGFQEIHERKEETGLLLAMGVSYSYIIALYILKALILSLIAGLIGFVLGSWLSVYLTAPFLITNSQPVTFIWADMPRIIGLIMGVTLLAEILPILKLLKMDPSIILTEER